jgi:hypothetical protein
MPLMLCHILCLLRINKLYDKSNVYIKANDRIVFKSNLEPARVFDNCARVSDIRVALASLHVSPWELSRLLRNKYRLGLYECFCG